MKLRKKVSSLSDVPEQFHDLYTEDDDGNFVLDVVDPDGKKEIDEFRRNNRSLNKTVEEMKAKLESLGDLASLDEDGVKALQEARRKAAAMETDDLLRDLVDSEGRVDKDRLNAYAERQFQGEKSALEKRMESMATEREELEARLGSQRDKLTSLARDSRVRQILETVAQPKAGAMDHVLRLAAQQVQFDDDDNMVITDANGDVRYGKKGGENMTLDEWAQEVVETNNFLFEGQRGGGSNGDNSPKPRKGILQVDGSDPEALGQHREAIMKGEAEVI